LHELHPEARPHDPVSKAAHDFITENIGNCIFFSAFVETLINLEDFAAFCILRIVYDVLAELCYILELD
jgi:hypothetical protein